MSDKTEICEVDGCENDAHTICEQTDYYGKVIAKQIFCKGHLIELLSGEQTNE